MQVHLADAALEANEEGDKKKRGSNSPNDQEAWRKGTEAPSLFPILGQKAAARSPFPRSRSEHLPV